MRLLFLFQPISKAALALYGRWLVLSRSKIQCTDDVISGLEVSVVDVFPVLPHDKCLMSRWWRYRQKSEGFSCERRVSESSVRAFCVWRQVCKGILLVIFYDFQCCHGKGSLA